MNGFLVRGLGDDHLTCITATGVYVASRAECDEQLADWGTYRFADNFAGWLVKRGIMDGNDLVAAEENAQCIMAHGSSNPIDVRI